MDTKIFADSKFYPMTSELIETRKQDNKEAFLCCMHDEDIPVVETRQKFLILQL